MIQFGSVCSGIEAASVAWHPLGWRAAWLAEIDPFPSAVLAHHYPDVPNLGDMTALVRRILSGDVAAPDVFTGGTPCQAFSVAGNRGSLDDARGNLTLTFCEIANAIDHVRTAAGREPCVVMWENVPGVLSTRDNAFGCFLGALAGSGCELLPAGFDPDSGKPASWSNAGCVYGPGRAVAWRVLDAQYFGLAQRRRRVFVVASARNGFDPAAVLFESDGLRRDSAPRREAREGTARGAENGAGCGGVPALARCVTTGEAKRQDWETCTIIPAIAHTLRAEGFDASEDGTGRGTPLVPVASHPTQDPISSTDGTTHCMGTGSSEGCATVAVAYTSATEGLPQSSRVYHEGDTAPTLQAAGTRCGNRAPQVQQAMAVRRLTPRECERLQGFPDDYTLIPWRGKPAEDCPDGPRYKALGNSWAVPCARWIGERIARALA